MTDDNIALPAIAPVRYCKGNYVIGLICQKHRRDGKMQSCAPKSNPFGMQRISRDYKRASTKPSWFIAKALGDEVQSPG